MIDFNFYWIADAIKKIYPNKEINEHIYYIRQYNRWIHISTPIDDNCIHYELSSQHLSLHFEYSSSVGGYQAYVALVDHLTHLTEKDARFHWRELSNGYGCDSVQPINNPDELITILQDFITFFDHAIEQYFLQQTPSIQNIEIEQEQCIVKEDVNPENGEQKQVDLECQVKVGNPGQFNGLEIVPSKSIVGIPSEPKLLNPALVDELIEIGEIKNYSLPENKKETIPVFNATSLDTNDSEKTGVFYINGEIPPKFELNKNIEFELTLLTGQKVLCTIPKVKPGKKEIKIECVLQEELNGTTIKISPCAAFDGYNEIIRLNKIETEKPINMPNGKEIKLTKKFDIDLSFGQLSGFAPRTNLIFFYFVGFVGKPIKKGQTIKMMVNLLKNGLPVEQEANCTVIEDVNPTGQSQAQFDCEVDNVEKPNDFEGLELVSSDEISGIPNDPNLLNPAKVDILIKEGNMANYTSPEFKKEEIPVFNPTSLDTNDSEKTGVFYINGEVPATFESKTETNLLLFALL